MRRALREIHLYPESSCFYLKKKLAEENVPLDVRRRLERVLEKVATSGEPTPERLQFLRTLWLLERLATPEAKEIVSNLGKGASGSQLTQEALAALKRWK